MWSRIGAEPSRQRFITPLHALWVFGNNIHPKLAPNLSRKRTISTDQNSCKTGPREMRFDSISSSERTHGSQVRRCRLNYLLPLPPTPTLLKRAYIVYNSLKLECKFITHAFIEKVYPNKLMPLSYNPSVSF
jgi:hypothetical protein